MKKNFALSLSLGILLSSVTLYLAFRNVPFEQLLIYLSSINYWWMLPSAGLVLFSFGLRAVRWRLILQSVRAINFWGAFHPMMIGFMINCILPGRLGEVARPAILQKRDRIPFSSGFATVAVERVFDISLLVMLFGLMSAFVKIDSNLSVEFGGYRLTHETLTVVGQGMLQAMGLVIAGILMVSFHKTRSILNKFIMKIPYIFFFMSGSFKQKFETKICTPIVAMIDNLASGFSLIRHPKRIFFCIFLSIFIWVLSAGSFFVFAIGCPGVRLSFLEMAAVLIIVCFFIALPSAPGFWGLWEAGGIFAMSLFGIQKNEAAGFTLANHAIQIFPVILTGLMSAALTGVKVLEVVKEQGKGVKE
ncbi:MAG: lysylphosphatidylglycerol synthase transmembrane domain-containing protein [Thermodesulfobacteriota bacterium]